MVFWKSEGLNEEGACEEGMDLKGGAELTKGLAAFSLGGVIVTGSIETEGPSSMQISAEEEW